MAEGKKTPEDIIGKAIRITIGEFLQHVADVYPSEGDTLTIVNAFFKDKTNKQLVTYVEKQLFPYSAQIKARNLTFFEEKKKKIFKGLPLPYINHYTDLVLALNQPDLDKVWEFFNKFLALYDRLIKKKKNK